MRGLHRAVLGVIAAAAASFALATGCGDDGNGGGPAVRAAFDGLRQALVEGDLTGACERMTTRAARLVGTIGHGRATTCERDLRGFMVEAGMARRVRALAPKPVSISVDGDAATVIARTGDPWDVRLRFAYDDGTWKATSLFGNSGPPAEDVR